MYETFGQEMMFWLRATGFFLCEMFYWIGVVAIVGFIFLNFVIALLGGSYTTPIENLRHFYGLVYTHFFGRNYIGVLLTLCFLCLIVIIYKLFCG